MNNNNLVKKDYSNMDKGLVDVYVKSCVIISDASKCDAVLSEDKKQDELGDEINFNVKSTDKDLVGFVNRYFVKEVAREGSMKYTGFGSHDIIYSFSSKRNFNRIINDFYCSCWYNEELLTIITYCEGDIICEVFDDIQIFKVELESTLKFYRENY